MSTPKPYVSEETPLYLSNLITRGSPHLGRVGLLLVETRPLVGAARAGLHRLLLRALGHLHLEENNKKKGKKREKIRLSHIRKHQKAAAGVLSTMPVNKTLGTDGMNLFIKYWT